MILNDMQIAILGRQPAISLAELESLYGSANISPIDKFIAKINSSEPLPQPKLGGSLKTGTIIKQLKNSDVNKAYEYIKDNLAEHANQHVPDGKIQLGISVYGFRIPKNQMLRSNLALKKVLKSAGRSIRIIENKSQALETAQVLHNKLTSKQGIELLIIKDGRDAIIAQSTGVQDIDAYAKRDQGRPMRDAKVGMLPPKLAQILINLTNPNSNSSVLDPFCGTGVLMQEASLMGLKIFGTDIQERMIDYTHDNLVWLSRNKESSIHGLSSDQIMCSLGVGDATHYKWSDIFKNDNVKDYQVACETFLGKPLISLPPKNILDKIIQECDQIHEKFLRNIGDQIKPGTKLCLAVPAWRTKNGFLHLKTLDHLAHLGYTRMSFVHASNSELIYHRPDQTVARELVVLEKVRK